MGVDYEDVDDGLGYEGMAAISFSISSSDHHHASTTTPLQSFISYS